MDHVIRKRVEGATEQQHRGNPDCCLKMATWTYDFEVDDVAMMSSEVRTDKTIISRVLFLRQFAKGMTGGWILGKRQVMKEPSSNYLQKNARRIDG